MGGRHAAEAGLSQVGSLVGRAVWDAPHGQPLALRITGDGRVLGETSGASPIEIALDRVGLRGATAFQLAIGNAVGGAPAIAQRVTLDLEVVGPA